MITLNEISGNDRELRDAFGRFPSGVTAICALENAIPIGMAASAFVPVSLDPPLASVCVQKTSTTWPRLRRLERLGISFLGESHDAAARQLADKTGDRFAGIEWDATENGAVFVGGATAWLECTIHEEIPAGDHQIVLFRIERFTTHPKVNPLIFHSSRFHSSVPR